MQKEKADAEIDKHLNFTSLQIKNFSIDLQSASIVNDGQPSIKVMNLTHNLIQEFWNNSIPSLTELVLGIWPLTQWRIPYPTSSTTPFLSWLV